MGACGNWRLQNNLPVNRRESSGTKKKPPHQESVSTRQDKEEPRRANQKKRTKGTVCDHRPAKDANRSFESSSPSTSRKVIHWSRAKPYTAIYSTLMHSDFWKTACPFLTFATLGIW